MLFGQRARQRHRGGFALFPVFAEANIHDERLLRQQFRELHAQIERAGLQNQNRERRGIVQIRIEVIHGGVAIFLTKLLDFLDVFEKNQLPRCQHRHSLRLF